MKMDTLLSFLALFSFLTQGTVLSVRITSIRQSTVLSVCIASIRQGAVLPFENRPLYYTFSNPANN